MGTIEAVRWAVWAYVAAWTFYLLMLPILGTVRRKARQPDKSREGSPSIGVIVPARNMASVIDRCVESLLKASASFDVKIYVVADHCEDSTAVRAKAAGASVLERNDGPAGKTYTLDWTFETLAEKRVARDLYIITDATATVDERFIAEIASAWGRGEDIIVSHPVVQPENRRWFAQSLGLMLAHRNLQNRSRERLGLSSLIEGRGMAYTRSYIERYRWSLALPTSSLKGSHPTEDWRHGVQAVEHGHRVAFADGARVITALRDSLSAATKQGIRWERGRMANAATHAVRLFFKGVRELDRVKTLAALDALQPPVAILGAISAVVAVWSWLTAGTLSGALLGASPLILLIGYALAIVRAGARDGIDPKTILWAPLYICWRCMSFALAWAFLDRVRAKNVEKASEES